jgi:hypothetical protein
MASEEDDLEVEEATSLNAHSAKKPAPPQEPTAAASPPLTGNEKKKQQKRTWDHVKRKATTIASLSSPLPPLPSPRILQKATESIPLSLFAAVTVNLGPASVSPPHTDGANKADGMCLIGALGSFDAEKGGHIVCWDYNLIIQFPAGCSVLIPSAVVTHSNTPIQEGEERYSIIQYSAGTLFR